jgi:hypothetical protein
MSSSRRNLRESRGTGRDFQIATKACLADDLAGLTIGQGF